MSDIVTKVIGRISTLLGYDGTSFRAVKLNTSGQVEVDVKDIVAGKIQLYAYTGTSWVPVLVTPEGRVYVASNDPALNAVGAYGLAGGTTWKAITVDGSGRLYANVNTIPEGEIRGYVHDGLNWKRTLSDTDGTVHVNATKITAGEIRMYAWDGGAWREFLVDESGLIGANVYSISTGQIKNQVYDGAAWQNQKADAAGYTQIDMSKVRGHADVIPFQNYDVIRANYAFTVTAGQNWVAQTAVTAGFYFLISNIVYYNITAAGTSWQLFLYADGANILLDEISAPVANRKEKFGLDVWMKANDYLWFRSNGAGVGNELRLSIVGVKMRTAA